MNQPPSLEDASGDRNICSQVTVPVITAKASHLWRAQTTNDPFFIFPISGLFSLGLLNGVFIQKKGGPHSSLLLIAFSMATVPGLIANPRPWLETRADPSHSCGSVGVRPPIGPGKHPDLLHPMKTYSSSSYLSEPPDRKLHSQLGLIHSPT